MTSDQCHYVRVSLDALREVQRPFALLFYGRLFELEPSLHRLFHKDLGLQGKSLMKAFETISHGLDDLESLRPQMQELGRKHAEYGVNSEHYRVFSTALLWALAQALGSEFDRETRDAWQAAMGSICRAMESAAAPPAAVSRSS
jgi:hemoglobin-like flavoprotein